MANKLLSKISFSVSSDIKIWLKIEDLVTFVIAISTFPIKINRLIIIFNLSKQEIKSNKNSLINISLIRE